MGETILQLKTGFNQLIDADKHYQRKEFFLFPYPEKIGVTGPPMVMWGKHEEIRENEETVISEAEFEVYFYKPG